MIKNPVKGRAPAKVDFDDIFGDSTDDAIEEVQPVSREKNAEEVGDIDMAEDTEGEVNDNP